LSPGKPGDRNKLTMVVAELHLIYVFIKPKQ